MLGYDVYIHHFDGNNTLWDMDGDPLCGWYFQISQTEPDLDHLNIDELQGPYGDQSDCEAAARKEMGV